MHVGRKQHTVSRTSLDVHMGLDASLADQLELGQAVEQLASNSFALANQDEGLGIGEDVDIVEIIFPDGHLVV